MNELNRKYLTGSIMLSRYEDGSYPEEYIIKSVIGEGSSTVCYEAIRRLKNGFVETGKLKEFYPIDCVVGNKSLFYSLQRLPNGQLVSGVGTVRKFESMCQDYLGTYKLLRKVMVDHPDHEILKGYIQHGEILYGIIEQENQMTYKSIDHSFVCKPTVYIWSPGVPGKGFDLYLQEIKKNPTKNPEKKLKDILCVIDQLTDCIKALHTAGLMHMDIKPSNFLIQYDSDFEINPNSISLFDINTLCSIESEYLSVSGTQGFRAPEVLRGKADNRSDIYSIGAVLFNSIVIKKDIPDGLYQDSYYSSINQLVKHSSLFLASETNADASLMSTLCKILEKCLVKDPRKRYQSCSELKKDLEKAIERLTKMLYKPIEKRIEGLIEPIAVIQKLLYEHPLYESVDQDAKEMNVLVIGLGTYSQKFIDVCLQSGQMSGIDLNIVAVSDEIQEDKASYLRFRPAISEFVNVDGSLNGKENLAYATLDFKGTQGLSFTMKMSDRNKKIVKALIQQSKDLNKAYDYIFVSLGKDSINKSIANYFSQEINYSCPICYVTQSNINPKKTDIKNRLYPVCINVPIDIATIDQRLGEMAFNTHISWKNSMNIDIMSERKKFFESDDEKDKYNRTSSLAFALSVKYKLHSVHIDTSDLLQAANLFFKQILEARFIDPKAKQKFDCLVDLEHRRWLIEKAVDGWSAPRDDKGNLRLEDCITRGAVKDAKNRTHPCMVRGSQTSPLSDPKYEADHHLLWNVGEIDENLDELDHMSIELHRCFRNHAEEIKNDLLLQNSDIFYIQNLIPKKFDQVDKAFKQFQFALKNILNGVERYSRLYDDYQEAFENTINVLSDEVQTKILKRLAVIKHTFFPIVESNLYRNYKANDEILIQNIPFILTYQYMPAIAVAFEDGKHQKGRNDAMFANVASATVLNPEIIRYLYCFNKHSDIDSLIRKMDAIVNYFGKRNIHSKIEFIIACLYDVSNKQRDHLQKELTKLKKKYLNTNGNASFIKEEIYDVHDYGEATEIFIRYLKEFPVDLYDEGNPLLPSAYDHAKFIEKITELNIPHFEFDWRKKIFFKRIGCDYLQFLKDRSFIRIRDMFALMNVTDHKYNLSEFADDYEDLWKIYTGSYLSDQKFENGMSYWNHLCEILSDYEKAQKPLAKIMITASDTVLYKKEIFFLPEYTYITVKEILHKLKEYGIVGEESNVITHTSDTCKLELKVNEKYLLPLKTVFNEPHILLPYYGINVVKYKTSTHEYVEIRYHHLEVNHVNLDPQDKGYGKYIYDLLKALQQAHFITQVEGDCNHTSSISFKYSSPRIKKILTHAEEILKIYAYYDVLKIGYFDDVACGYEFSWEFNGEKNELDLVLTKGFRSMIVECKTNTELKPDDYQKIHSIADQFGIKTIKVLLSNTYHNEFIEQNDMQIKTIYGEKNIKNIGQVLKNLMEKN